MGTDPRTIVNEQKDKFGKLISNPIIKGAMSAGLSGIPFFGPAIVSALDQRAFNQFERNAEKITEEFRDAIEYLDEEKIDKKFLESDEFVSLVLTILTKNAHTYQVEKIRIFAQFLVNSISKDFSGEPFKEGFLKIIEELSPIHFEILKKIYEHSNKLKEFPKKEVYPLSVISLREDLEIEKDKIIAYCMHLLQYGLIRNWSEFADQTFINKFIITGYGERFIEFIIRNR